MQYVRRAKYVWSCGGFIAALFMLALAPVAGAGPADPAAGDRELAIAIRESFPDPQPSLPIAFRPGNLCREARIRDSENAEFRRDFGSALVAAIDEDPTTHLTRRVVPGEWFEIKFPGSRRWMNFVDIEYEGADDFRFEALNSAGEREEIRIVGSYERESTRGHRIRTIEFAPVEAHGLRWSWQECDADEGFIDIFELRARFFMADPDPADGINWLLCETGDPLIGPPDIRPLWNKISALPAWCPWRWHACHLWLPPADWAGDFKLVGPPAFGGENLHVNGFTGMDFHDLSVIACHGAPSRIWFTTGPPPARSGSGSVPVYSVGWP